MNFSLSEQEYRLLMEMIYLADWMMHAYSEKDGVRHGEHIALKKKLLAQQNMMESEDIIGPDYDEYMQEKFIKTYDERTFFEELSVRVAQLKE